MHHHVGNRRIRYVAGGAAEIRSAVKVLHPYAGIGTCAVGCESSCWRRPERRAQGLKEAGFVEGQNLRFEYRWAEGHYDRLPALAMELVDRHVAVIVPIGGAPATVAAKAATSTVPIIFNMNADPLELGLIASLNRPGGNVTGVAMMDVELEVKRLELLRELVPASALIAMLINPSNAQPRHSHERCRRWLAPSDNKFWF